MRKLATLFPKPSVTGWIAIAVTTLVVVAAIVVLALSGATKPLLKVEAGQAPASALPTPQTGLPYTPAPNPHPTSTGAPAAPPSSVDAKGETLTGVVPGQEQVQEANTGDIDGKSPNQTSGGSAWTNPSQPGAPNAPAVLPGALGNGGPQPTKVAMNQPAPAGGGTADQTAVLTTGNYVNRFGPEITSARNSAAVTATQNICLDQWVTAHVHDYDGRSGIGTQTICGLTVAYTGGAAGIDETTFIGQAKYNLNVGARAVLIDARNTNMAFASARTGSGTDDHGTVLMVAANL